MKKYLGLKKFSGKVVAAMLAASMLIGNVGAMKPAVTSRTVSPEQQNQQSQSELEKRNKRIRELEQALKKAQSKQEQLTKEISEIEESARAKKKQKDDALALLDSYRKLNEGYRQALEKFQHIQQGLGDVKQGYEDVRQRLEKSNMTLTMKAGVPSRTAKADVPSRTVSPDFDVDRFRDEVFASRAERDRLVVEAMDIARQIYVGDNELIFWTAYVSVDIDRSCKIAELNGKDPVAYRRDLEANIRKYQNHPYFIRVKNFAREHQDILLDMVCDI